MVHNYCYVHRLQVGGVSVILEHGRTSPISICFICGPTMDGHLLVLRQSTKVVKIQLSMLFSSMLILLFPLCFMHPFLVVSPLLH
jgi:hypothetical protein